MRLLWQFLVGFVLSAAIAFVAYRRRSLSKSGVLGAMMVGTAIFGFGGWVWGLLLIAFFVLSSLLSHYKQREKERVAADKFDKGGTRDIGQALANGGAGALIAAAYALTGSDALLFAAFLGAMASVNADTWATELGVLSHTPPRLITTLKPVEPGTSGGVSLLGMLATAGGALTIALCALAFMALDGLFGGPGLGVTGPAGGRLLQVVGIAVLSGLAGSLFDSLLGATVQAIYRCPTCRKDTEKRLHTCGTPTRQVRGWAWLTNDLVNFVSSLVGAGIAVALGLLLGW